MKTRFQLIIFIAIMITLSLTAKKCRQLVNVGDEAAFFKRKQFSCFDRRSGTIACMIKQGVKLYFYNIRPGGQVERATKLGTRHGQRVIGPIIASGWDFLEVVYYGGTMMEASLRGSGTFFGTYYFGFIGEKKVGRVGYLVGSYVGSWIGGKMGLMIYDLVNGVYYFMGLNQEGEIQHYDESIEINGHDPQVGKYLVGHEDL